MSDELNVVLGQLEDELRQIKSAKDQVESALSTNAELSASLERLIASSKELVEESNGQTRSAVDALSKEVTELSELSKAIEQASSDGAEVIRIQASNAQSTLEETAGSAIAKIASETEASKEGLIATIATLSDQAQRMEQHSQVLEKESSQTVDAIRKQASDAQSALEAAASSALERSSAEIAGYTEQAVENLNNGLNEARSDIGKAAESLNEAKLGIDDSRDTLLKAHDEAMSNNRQQSSETRALLEEAQRHLVDIDARIATLKDIDIDSLVKELKELKDVEAADTAALKKQLTSITFMVGACIVICLIALVKSFIA